MNVIDICMGIQADIVKWRRDLHEIPELGMELEKTHKYVTDELTKMNISYKTISKTGIVAIIEGISDGPTIAIRADMDGLPIKEKTKLPFSSKNNCMHACGHDAHTSMLLATAKILSENKTLLKGNVKLIFQPAEEISAGAEALIKKGILENPKVDFILGLHIGALFPEVKLGMIGVKSGYITSAVDKISVTVKGKGGHGAMPHLSVDPILIASEIISSLQKIVSRETNPLHPVVVTIGSINGGSSWNIIPEKVTFEGTIRSIYPEDRNLLEKRVVDICEGIGKANGAEVKAKYERICPSVNNNPNTTDFLIKSAEKVVGRDNMIILENPTMVSEDMAYYLEEVPGTFFFLGSNNPQKKIIYPHHHPKFTVDEDVLWIGPAVFIQSVFDFFDSI